MTITHEDLLITFARTPCLTGREAFLQTLRETLLRDRFAIITGPTGVGKTSVALEYARLFAAEYQEVFWLNATTPEAFQANTVALLQGFSLPLDGQRSPDSLFQAILTWLSQQKGVLLVLDHILSPRLLKTQTEQQPADGHIILIPRSTKNISLPLSPLKLESLSPRDGALLALRRAGLLSMSETLEAASDELQHAALELAVELRGLPLAINLAGGYLRATHSTPQEYLLAHRAHPTILPQPGRPAGTDRHTFESIETACSLVLPPLKRAEPAAFEILNQCAFLSSDGIPATLFEQALPAATSTSPSVDMQEEREQDMIPLAEALQVLLNYGLLDAQGGTGALTMHELLQVSVRQFLPLDKQQLMAERALHTLRRFLLTLEEKPLPIRLRTAGHIRRLAELSEEWILTTREAAEVLGWAASLLWEQGFPGEAEPLLRKALPIWERTLGLVNPIVAAVLFNLATLNTQLKNYPQAEELAQRATRIKARVSGVTHPDVLLSLNQLAQIYEQQEKQEQARLCYQQTIEIGERVGLQNDSSYLQALYQLALFALQQKQYARARPLLEQVCTAWADSLGFGESATIQAWHKLADLAVKTEDWELALTCYQRVVPAYGAWRGEEHPETLHCLEEAAEVLIEWNELAEAEMHLQQVLHARERLQGVDHPEVAACLNRLANVALQQERITEAQGYLTRALHIHGSRPEPEDTALAVVLDTLVLLHIIQAEAALAISVAERSLAIRIRVLGQMHLELVTNLSTLASLYLVLGQPDRAEPLLLHALAIYQHAQKPEDMALDPVLDNLATVEMKRGHLEQAKMFLERLYSIRRHALGEHAFESAQTAQKLARIALSLGQREAAEKHYRRALLAYETGLEPEDKEALTNRKQLATIAALLGKTEKLECAEDCLKEERE